MFFVRLNCVVLLFIQNITIRWASCLAINLYNIMWSSVACYTTNSKFHLSFVIALWSLDHFIFQHPKPWVCANSFWAIRILRSFLTSVTVIYCYLNITQTDVVVVTLLRFLVTRDNANGTLWSFLFGFSVNSADDTSSGWNIPSDIACYSLLIEACFEGILQSMSFHLVLLQMRLRVAQAMFVFAISEFLYFGRLSESRHAVIGEKQSSWAGLRLRKPRFVSSTES